MTEDDLKEIRNHLIQAQGHGFAPYWQADTDALKTLVWSDVPELLAEVTRLRTALEAAKIPHLIVDGDSWYSCPLAPDWDGDGYHSCQDIADEDRRCWCGADAHNAAIDKALGH